MDPAAHRTTSRLGDSTTHGNSQVTSTFPLFLHLVYSSSLLPAPPCPPLHLLFTPLSLASTALSPPRVYRTQQFTMFFIFLAQHITSLRSSTPQKMGLIATLREYTHFLLGVLSVTLFSYGKLYSASEGETLYTSFQQKASDIHGAGPVWTLTMGVVGDASRTSTGGVWLPIFLCCTILILFLDLYSQWLPSSLTWALVRTGLYQPPPGPN